MFNNVYSHKPTIMQVVVVVMPIPKVLTTTSHTERQVEAAEATLLSSTSKTTQATRLHSATVTCNNIENTPNSPQLHQVTPNHRTTQKTTPSHPA